MKSALRQSFEDWITVKNPKWTLDRFPKFQSKPNAELGQYKNPEVQLAWDAWSQAAVLLTCNLIPLTQTEGS